MINMTNGEKVRTMTDEHLADLIGGMISEKEKPYYDCTAHEMIRADNRAKVLRWLKWPCMDEPHG